jgi:D-amino-acid dehydrogenase
VTKTVAVIGAGMVGVFTALALQRDGHAVVLIEPGAPGGEQAASYGNGAWLSPGSILPVSMPGLWRQVPGMLADPLGPFAIRFRHLPRLAPWLIRFVAAGATLDKVEAVAEARHRLLHGAAARFRETAAGAGLIGHVVSDGLLHVYPNRAAFEAEGFGWRLRERLGIRFRTLDRDALIAEEPGLGESYRFGALVEDGAHLTDPGGLVAGLFAHAVAAGASVVRAPALGFVVADGKLRSVRTPAGAVACDAAVICAGIASGTLAAAAGDPVPLASERGYHVVFDRPAHLPQRPIMPSDGKMAVTMTRHGLRIAGQVELASVSAPPDWRRADILARYAAKLFPAAATPVTPARRWMGHRPSTPDGLPSIGRASECADILHNLGHGHTGIVMAPASAALVADLITGRAGAIDPTPYAPQRFRGRRAERRP